MIVDDGGATPSASPQRLPVGATGKTLHANAALPYGVGWQTIDLTGAATLLVGPLPLSLGGTGGTDASTARIALGAQPLDSELTALASVTSAADRVPYFTGSGTASVAVFTALARTLLANATAALMRSTLEQVLPRYGLLASKIGINLNSSATDNAVVVESARYRVDKIVVTNASINLTTATLGVFTAAGGGGTTIAADQALTVCSAASKFHDLTLGGSVTADVVTAATIYLRVGTAQGASATANVFVFGYALD